MSNSNWLPINQCIATLLQCLSVLANSFVASVPTQCCLNRHPTDNVWNCPNFGFVQLCSGFGTLHCGYPDVQLAKKKKRTDICACMHVLKQECCTRTNISTSKYSRLLFTNKDFSNSTRTQSCHLSAGSCVTACPPICCWLIEAKQCSLWRRGEMRGADGHTIHFLKQTQKLLSLGLVSGRWDGVSWEEHPFSTCHLWAKEKSKVDLQKNWK